MFSVCNVKCGTSPNAVHLWAAMTTAICKNPANWQVFGDLPNVFSIFYYLFFSPRLRPWFYTFFFVRLFFFGLSTPSRRRRVRSAGEQHLQILQLVLKTLNTDFTLDMPRRAKRSQWCIYLYIMVAVRIPFSFNCATHAHTVQSHSVNNADVFSIFRYFTENTSPIASGRVNEKKK